ncbi:HIT domain-containing protein [Candidatus Curtissbacteria bacterium]|nr:HIT domain-containing protein [Candidatus Curtissbacteria bacterium]
MTAKDCIFCKVIRGEIKSAPVFENESIVAINDINPLAQIHVLIFPKNHIEGVLTVSDEDSGDVIAMFKAAAQIVRDKKLEAFRLAFNGGRYQHVPHLHMHLLAGGSVRWERL